MNRNLKSPRWLRTSPAIVCAHIANAALGRRNASGAAFDVCEKSVGESPSVLGEITLRPHQVDAVGRIRASLQSLGGALLADAVGLGKTYVALAVAREYDNAHIIAPATLLPMWRDAIAAADAPNISLHSLHTLSRRPILTDVAKGRTIVIVDEAHHLRTRNTVRYRNAQQFTVGRDVLLLSATPVHNRTRELRNLLALFLGHRADAIDRTTLAECVVRRTTIESASGLVPSVIEHPAVPIPDNRAVLECILQIAPPLPVNEGAAASALVRLGLLRAWCSSDAALTDRIRRRQLRGEALLHSLAHGKYPTQRELESWIVGSDSVQLGFPELLIATASGDASTMLKTLVEHLDSLQHLLQLHTRTSVADAARTSALRAMLRDENQPPIIAFSQFVSTVRALHRALSDMAGVASLTAAGGQIASGGIARQELIANFAPRANGRPPPQSHQRIRLLLTTDLLAEGVNLQDAGIVLHIDLPWTHALKQQRVGRVARMGSSFTEVHVHTFAPPMGAESALKLIATLERKAGLHRALIGRNQDPREGVALEQTSAPDDATELRTLLVRWQSTAPINTREYTVVGVLTTSQRGWIAVVHHDNAEHVLAQVESSQPDADTSTLLRAAQIANAVLTRSDFEEPCSHSVDLDAHEITRVFHEIKAWLFTRELQSLTGKSARSVSPAQKRALDALSHRLNTTSAAHRAALAARVSSVEQCVLQCRGAGAEQILADWVARGETQSLTLWLDAFPLSQSEFRVSGNAQPDHQNPAVIAILVMQSDRRTQEDNSL